MRKERVRSKHGFKGVGTFILGWFIGLISTILLLAGVGYWAYTSISVKDIEKWTKSDIAGGNKDVEKLTLQDVVNIAMGIAKGSDDYTVAKFEEDFGIKILGDSLYGISLDQLKNAPFKDFKTAINDTIDSATFNNILSFMDVEEENLGLLKTVLDGEITYYVVNGKLCTEEGKASSEVDFKYTIEGNTVKFSNGAHTISSGKITPRFRDLPLNTAMTSMTDATEGLKIYEILDYHYDEVTEKYYENYSGGVYSNPVSGVMSAIAGYTIDDLGDQSKINDLKVFEVMGYYYNQADECYYTTSTFDDGTKVTGVMNALAGKTLGDLGDQSKINALKIYEVMGYYYNEADESYYTTPNFAAGTKVSAVMNSIADKTLDELSDGQTFDNLYIYEVMGYTRVEVSADPLEYKYTNNGNDVTGVMAAIAGKKISELDDAGAFDDVKVADAMGYYQHTNGTYYTTSTFEEGTEVTGIMATLAGKKISELDDAGAFDDVKVADAMGYYQHTNGTYYTTSTFEEGTEVTGIMATLAGKKISELDDAGAFDDVKVADAMGYYQHTNGTYYTTSTFEEGTEVTGIMATLAGKKISELDDAGAFNDVVVADALGYYKHANGTYYTTSTFEPGTEVTGVISHLAGSSIAGLSAEIQNLSLGKILGVEKGDANNSAIINALYDSSIDTLNEDIKTLRLGQILGVEKGAASNSAVIEALYNSTMTTLNEDINNLTLGAAIGVQLSSATGAIKVLYDTKITELNTAMGNLKVYQAMGYYYNETNQKYYNTFDGTEYKNEVTLTGIIKAIAQSEVDELTTTIESLKAKDIFDRASTPILNLFVTKNGDGTENTTELDNLTVMNMPNAVVNKINASTTKIGTLIDAGVITTSTTIAEDDPVRLLTIAELIEIAMQFS